MKLLCWSKVVSAAALSITVLAACSEIVGSMPERLDAVYVATSNGGEPIPLTEIDGDQTRTLLADTLRFSSDGTVKWITVLRIAKIASPSQATVYYSRLSLPYTIDGTSLSMLPPCPINANCVGVDRASISMTRVVLPYSMFNGQELILSRRDQGAEFTTR